MAGLMAAAVIAAVLMFFTGPLPYVPNAALGAVLVQAALVADRSPTLEVALAAYSRESGLERSGQSAIAS